MKVDTTARLLELPSVGQLTLKTAPLPDRPLIAEGEAVEESSFREIVKGFIEQVNQQQIEKDEITAGFLAGQIEDVHTAMVAMEKANISFQFLLEVRNKLLESYRDVMRMQV